MSEKQDWIARKAYELWERSGRLEGQDHLHWQDANREWEAHHNFEDGGDRSHSRSAWDDEEDQ